MIVPRPKRPRLRLDPQFYQELRERVFERDGWRCQHCGSLSELQLHHIQARSQLGNDAEENLITLCVQCHMQAHFRI
jgi:5-methylcytosine-specific restriction endonuclease McrA